MVPCLIPAHTHSTHFGSHEQTACKFSYYEVHSLYIYVIIINCICCYIHTMESNNGRHGIFMAFYLFILWALDTIIRKYYFHKRQT